MLGMMRESAIQYSSQIVDVFDKKRKNDRGVRYSNGRGKTSIGLWPV